MYESIHTAYSRLSNGDRAEIKRASLQKLGDLPAYFRVLKMTGAKDNRQTKQILYLIADVKISEEDTASPVAKALYEAGVKESQVIQIVRSGDNGIEYLKRQLLRCKNLQKDSLGKLAQYWGEKARRDLLKAYILAQPLAEIAHESYD